MRFSVLTLFDFFPTLQNEVDYYQDTLDLMIRADQLGFDSVWVGEEHFYTVGICPSPQLFLTALARETRHIRLGTAISLLPFENPLRKAEDFAMLDILSGGRLNFGVGRGLIPKHFEGFRVAPEESQARYEEALEIIQRAWTQERVSYDGQFWQIPELSLSPKPLQKPHPPIYRGTISMESFELAGVKGTNAFVVPWLTARHPEVKRRVERYRTALQEHGHDAGQTENVFVFFVVVDTDRQRALAEAKEITGRYGQLATLVMPPAVAQLPAEDPRKAFYDQVTSLSNEVEERAIVGTPQDCRRRLTELREEFGIEHLAMYLHAGARNTDRARYGMELFAQEVMPEFR